MTRRKVASPAPESAEASRCETGRSNPAYTGRIMYGSHR